MLLKISSRYPVRREDGISLAETVVAVAIMVLVLTSTAYALTSAFNGTSSSQNFNKAYQLISKQFAITKQVSFDKLGTVTTEATNERNLVQSLSYCSVEHQNANRLYNRDYDVPDKDHPLAADGSCVNYPTQSNISCPTYNAAQPYNGEDRVELQVSNSGLNGIYPNNGDPGTSQNETYPVYCAWYQFGQGNGDVLYNSDVAPCAAGSTSAAPHQCVAGGVGTIFTVETDVTWVNSSAYDTSDGTNGRNDSSSFTNCYAVSTAANCFQAKRVTVTVRWVEASPSGPQQRGVTSSFIRAPTIAECLPVSGNGFVANATPVATPNPSANAALSGVSCGKS